ncbi:HutD family protein [Bacillus sp. FJAT-26390]|uniref:HutD/Ves family protein n=1 Tax=Bacillus sp. FJAT-26390 TaxID=1743142 RepID=UPI00080802E7|nr:HutD family protein [Bacillus sp. FJAT-26390]OBZ16984.1 hypothetical protein A7975_03555 [Bacillus sp. FJAT-26390]
MVIITLSYHICRKEQQRTSTWSGGTTTEVAIYPPDAVYSKRNFAWRISTATVEVEQSTFSPLPGIWRLTMVTEGEMLLRHEGYHQAVLKPYEQDSYSGEWTTQSFGKVKDFNLMLTEGNKGELQALFIDEHPQSMLLGPYLTVEQLSPIFEAFYCVDGTIDFSVDGGTAEKLYAGDMLLLSGIDSRQQLRVQLSSVDKQKSSVIQATLFASS